MRYLNYKNAIKDYVKNNYREYILISLLFIIGIFVGVMIINNIKENQITEIITYLKDFVEKYKKIENINKSQLIIQAIKRNLLFTFVLWLAGTTVIGMPIVLIMILIRGIILGFTISSITITFGILKGIIFCISSIALQNFIYIPIIFTISVSSIKLYKSIIKDKRKENIKMEIIRHTIIFCLMIILLVVSAIIENVISINILKNVVKYF